MVDSGVDLEGVLLDVDGTLTVAWRPLPGAAETLSWLRGSGIPFLLATNATSLSRQGLASKLGEAGIEVRVEELLTASVAAAAYLRTHHPGARCFLLGNPDLADELDGIKLVEEDAEVVLMAGADPAFTWASLSRALRLLVGGAALVAMHRNLSWLTADGLMLDAGAYVMGLERAAGVKAAVTGKPAPDFFRQGVELLGVPAEQAAMVGDDLEADVLAAQACGLTGVLVRTGKFRPEALRASERRPDNVIGSIANLPELFG
jgi:HAD superfamily hydrolase (TIGR01458 family)